MENQAFLNPCEALVKDVQRDACDNYGWESKSDTQFLGPERNQNATFDSNSNYKGLESILIIVDNYRVADPYFLMFCVHSIKYITQIHSTG